MKHCLLIAALVLFCLNNMFGQKILDGIDKDSAKLYVEYADFNGYINDSVFSNMKSTSLFLGKKASVYIYQLETVEDFLNKMKKSIKVNEGRKLDTNTLINSFKKNYDLEKIVSVIYLKQYTSPDFLQLRKFNEGDVWLSDTATYSWKLIDEFRTIHDYRCQKATSISTKGEEIIAWFTEQIPYSAGPLSVSGLPGLILEYYNTGTKRFFKTVTISSTNIPEQRFRIWLNGLIVSKSEYAEIYSGESKMLDRFKKLMNAQNVTN